MMILVVSHLPALYLQDLLHLCQIENMLTGPDSLMWYVQITKRVRDTRSESQSVLARHSWSNLQLPFLYHLINFLVINFHKAIFIN